MSAQSSQRPAAGAPAGPARRSATLLVLDGLGVGALPDAARLRAADATADTLGAVARWSLAHRRRPLRVPHLAGLGLAAVRPDLAGAMARPVPLLRAAGARSALGYPGADSFAGHQTLMGADMSHVVLRRLAESQAEVAAALKAAGHRVEPLAGGPVLVVDGAALVHDNLEADPGLNWNVSCRLADLPFEEVVAVARTVRAVAPVARVIAVGGDSDGPLAEAVRPGADGTVGLDTPASGFYRNGGLRVLHLGAEVDHRRQLHGAAAAQGRPVALVGKAADLLRTDAEVERRFEVETERILASVRELAGRGLVVANVQRTDLAGHSRDAEAFADQLELVDAALPGVAERLGPDDLLVVTGDHGNDPAAGHPFHTREWVPVLAATGGPPGAVRGADLATLADVGASAARWLRLGRDATAVGTATDLLAPAPGAPGAH
ncbi:phosphopentomutase [Streptomonospora sp. S1-112]|uniref:Phosphopentomutase n=1 Tax=Streptomonospora mangrovi TaxID=2883123 RepID=A0A9X3NKT2_9ACTN|nr:phosphopentomutase [Streptomonospora mangrovi]MDA0563896.1 phosphopentomutase [Streptomonospora mangrovi]